MSMTCRPADLVDEPTRAMLERAHERERRASQRNQALTAELAAERQAHAVVQAELAEARTRLAATQLELDEATAARASADAERKLLQASSKQAAAARHGREQKLASVVRMLHSEMGEADSARALLEQATRLSLIHI